MWKRQTTVIQLQESCESETTAVKTKVFFTTFSYLITCSLHWIKKPSGDKAEHRIFWTRASPGEKLLELIRHVECFLGSDLSCILCENSTEMHCAARLQPVFMWSCIWISPGRKLKEQVECCRYLPFGVMNKSIKLCVCACTHKHTQTISRILSGINHPQCVLRCRSQGFALPSNGFFSPSLWQMKSAQSRRVFCYESLVSCNICISKKWGFSNKTTLCLLTSSFWSAYGSLQSAAMMPLFFFFSSPHNFFFSFFCLPCEWSLLILHLGTIRKPHSTAVQKAGWHCKEPVLCPGTTSDHLQRQAGWMWRRGTSLRTTLLLL